MMKIETSDGGWSNDARISRVSPQVGPARGEYQAPPLRAPDLGQGPMSQDTPCGPLPFPPGRSFSAARERTPEGVRPDALPARQDMRS